MESDKVYLEKYLLKKTELDKKGELWRLRVTQEEFLSELKRLREYEVNVKKISTINEYHIQRNIENTISIMLMDILTFEESKKQIERLHEVSQKYFTEDAPNIIEKLKFIETPLRFRDSANIYRWIYRNQITIDMLPSKVKEEFVKTIHFERLKHMNKI